MPLEILFKYFKWNFTISVFFIIIFVNSLMYLDKFIDF